MKNIILIVLSSVLCLASIPAFAHESHKQTEVNKVKLENLMAAKLEGVKGTDVIVSRVTIPANKTLPKHWHPGEEFAYVLKGSVVLWQKGKKDIIGKAGDVIKVPLKQIHTAKTKNEPAVILVFRVHEQGKPERVLMNKK